MWLVTTVGILLKKLDKIRFFFFPVKDNSMTLLPRKVLRVCSSKEKVLYRFVDKNPNASK